MPCCYAGLYVVANVILMPDAAACRRLVGHRLCLLYRQCPQMQGGKPAQELRSECRTSLCPSRRCVR